MYNAGVLWDEVYLLFDSHDSVLLRHRLVLRFDELVEHLVRLVRSSVQQTCEPSVNLVVYLRLSLVCQVCEVL